MVVDLSAADPDRPDRHDVLPYERVRRAAGGVRKDYKLASAPIARGGQAEVFRGTHKLAGVPIAFKRLTAHDDTSVARMRREIEAARRFDGNPHVMPVLDADPRHTWFVMPLASETAQTLAAELVDPERLRDLVTAVCLALQTAHREGWVHRDLKPDNILRLDGLWKVADWGLGRRPRGHTSDQQRTAVGIHFGTIGFAAPELSVNAHDAGPQADVYSIGQIIGWALTGQWPRANLPLLPESEPWRAIARAATALEPLDRPADAEELLTLIAAELDSPMESSVTQGKRLLAAAADDPAAPGAVFRLAARAEADRELFHRVLFEFDEAQLRAEVLADPVSARLVVRAAQTLPEDDAATVVAWLLALARVATELAEWDLLGATAVSIFRLSHEEGIRQEVRNWLMALSGEAASTVAAMLGGHADARARFGDLANVSSVDYRIRHGLRAPPHLPADQQRADSAPEVEGPAWSRRNRTIVWGVVGVVAFIASIIAIVVSQLPDTTTPRTGGASGSTTSPNTPRVPTEMAGTPQLKRFVTPWDQYPSWMSCQSGDTETTVNGSFPAAVAEPISPTHGFSCDNGGNLTVLFGEFLAPLFYDNTVQRYRSARAPTHPVGKEAQPPTEVHVFQWSDTHRGLMWTDREVQAIGVAVTNSPTTDLVELWSKYRR